MNGPEFLLDTNVALGLLKGSPEAVALKIKFDLRFDRLALSQISRIEMLSFHALTPSEQALIDGLLKATRVLLLDEIVERAAIELRRKHRLKLPDAIIAATAEVHGLQLVTLDDRLARALAASSSREP